MKGRYTVVQEKRPLSFEEIEAQSALELPDREMMLVTVVITNLVNNVHVDVDVKNVNVAVQVCAIVELINVELLTVDSLTCEIGQR